MTMQAEETSAENWRALQDVWERVKRDWQGPNAEHFSREFWERLEFEVQLHLHELSELRWALERAKERLAAEDDS